MDTSDRCPAVGGVRYAPSPTGPLHLGNLRTAWISELIARTLGLPWVVRFEDIDRPRVREGSMQQQTEDLAKLGLFPDHVLIQSSFRGRHWDMFLAAVEAGRVYPCSCTRQEVMADLATMASASHTGGPPAYSGRCRHQDHKLSDLTQNVAWRFRHSNPQGTQDFVIARATPQMVNNRSHSDFTPSYHWACAIDDLDGAHQVIVRAHDLLHAARLQQDIQKLVSELDTRTHLSAAVIFHTSLVMQNDGHRLEKRSKGATLADLSAQQISVAKVKQGFASSWDPGLIEKISKALESQNSTILGEALEQIRLSNLVPGSGESP